MKATILACITAIAVLAIPAHGDDTEQIQGTWVVVSAELAGKTVEPSKGDKFIFTGDKVTIETQFKKSAFTFTLDPTTSQKQINIEDKPPKRGIYEFVGDQLKLCYAENNRPWDFDSRAGLLLVLKRQKP